ncbi:conserved hypothetical protein [Histoplasma capsulatum G186AR]|uniref:Uncharacterized protein n=1 Tax=Ajellomyces capsulatus (strain G186AR / H82 / ATCC MYA-2454 / RMSCC 2432) TaxID=447093 RepID=C0NF47_AJECG|nr:uncharacterized protein HCBG_01513 [Histoplasma capsulatum G186AR]EEH09868.1 conserved hypothetical protein [Histoplasma capsulatum G186AR]
MAAAHRLEALLPFCQPPPQTKRKNIRPRHQSAWNSTYPFRACFQILEPQSAILTNVEVLAHFSLNPPRRPPNPPPNSRNFTPSPDLRDHNTVVKEFHDYVTRLSPHLLNYPSFIPPKPAGDNNTNNNDKDDNDNNENNNTNRNGNGNGSENITTTFLSQTQPTALDNALREIISRFRPFQLTKAEVLMIVNLGIGLGVSGETGDGEGEDGVTTASAVTEEMVDGMEVDGGASGQPGRDVYGGIDEEADYGALALLDTVIEDREERLSTEDVGEILRIVRETLGKRGKGKGAGTRPSLPSCVALFKINDEYPNDSQHPLYMFMDICTQTREARYP